MGKKQNPIVIVWVLNSALSKATIPLTFSLCTLVIRLSAVGFHLPYCVRFSITDKRKTLLITLRKSDV